MSEPNPYTNATPLDQILTALQIWRNIYHADNIKLSRHDVTTIIEGVKQAQICCDSYAAENQRFHDEIERLRAARAWQAIETAPRDGTCFLACTGKWMTVCCWHRHSLQWISCGPTYSPYEGNEMPTHWQYLPEPPPCP